MKQAKKRTLYLSMAAASLLTACGGGNDSAQSSGSAPVTVTPASISGVAATGALVLRGACGHSRVLAKSRRQPTTRQHRNRRRRSVVDPVVVARRYGLRAVVQPIPHQRRHNSTGRPANGTTSAIAARQALRRAAQATID